MVVREQRNISPASRRYSFAGHGTAFKAFMGRQVLRPASSPYILKEGTEDAANATRFRNTVPPRPRNSATMLSTFAWKNIPSREIIHNRLITKLRFPLELFAYSNRFIIPLPSVSHDCLFLFSNSSEYNCKSL